MKPGPAAARALMRRCRQFLDGGNTLAALAALSCLVLAAFVLRLYDITWDSLWFDEAISWDEARRNFLGVIEATAQDTSPPLYNIILHAVIRSFGDRELALRAPSLVLGVVNVVAIYWTGTLLRNRATGFAAAALLTFSGFHIWYSQEARPYALLALAATVFVAALLRSLESGQRRWHGAAAAAAVVLLYSHPYGLLLWISVVAMLLLRMARRGPAVRQADRESLVWQAASGLCFLPWAVILLLRYRDLAEHGFWIPRPDWSRVLSMMREVSSGGAMAVVLALGAAAALIPGSRDVLSRRTTLPEEAPANRYCGVMAAWLLGPFLIGLIVSFAGQPVLWSRYLICSLPALILLAVLGYQRFDPSRGRWVAVAAVILSAVNLSLYERHIREDYRHAVAAYMASSSPQDCVIFYRSPIDIPFRYYAHNLPKCFAHADAVSDIRPWVSGSSRVWIFLGFASAQDEAELVAAMGQHGWTYREVPNWLVHLFVAEPAAQRP